MTKTYNFDRYVEEAATEPFRLQAGDQEIVISPPLGEVLLEMDVTTSPRRILELLCGDQYSAVRDLIRPQPSSVFNRLLGDMMNHFGANQVPTGGGGASSS